MARNIIFCADGTWDRPGASDAQGASSNVWKIFSALAGEATQRSDSEFFKEAPEQVALYVDGIGTTRLEAMNWIEGAVGLGVSQKIIDGYLHLSREYHEGDGVYIFGFSRGAYIARTLAGLVSQRGLLTLSGNERKDEFQAWDSVRKFTQGSSAVGDFTYRTTAKSYMDIGGVLRGWGMDMLASWADKGRRFFDPASAPIERPCPVTMVGVWDTVGALGVPVGMLDRASESLLEFKNLKLSPNVSYGYHALAIDEQREAFEPTLWEPRDGVEQVWFCGSHADVGGGYAMTGLSDFALRWMMERAADRGVQFDREPALAPNPLQEPTDSYSWKFGERRPRVVPEGAALHESVVEKLRKVPAYRPAALSQLAAGGDPAAYRIVADR